MAKKSLLLVDGDVRSLRVLEVSLRKAGYNLTTCGTARDALETLEYAQPDLILSDTRLPAMDGFALVEALRKNSDWAAIPIMFLSSDTSVESKVRGLQLGVEDYLTKPIYTKEILARIHLALNRRERDSFARGRASLSKTRFTGSLEDMGLVDLLQTIDVSRKSGVLDLRGPLGHGTITFREGQILDAELGRIHGERAVYRLLLWSEGDFDIEFRPVRSEAHIQTPTTGLLMEGMRRVDEWGRLLEQLPPLESVLEVVESELIPRLGEIPDELNPILKAVDGAHTLGDVVDVLEADDLQTLSSLSKLYFEGVIQPSQKARTLRPPDGVSGEENAVVGEGVEPDHRIAASSRADADAGSPNVPQSASIVPPPSHPPEAVSAGIPAILPPSTANDGATSPGTAAAKSPEQRPGLQPPRAPEAPARELRRTLLGPGFEQASENLLAKLDSPPTHPPHDAPPPTHGAQAREPSPAPRASSQDSASATSPSSQPSASSSSNVSATPRPPDPPASSPSASPASSPPSVTSSIPDREDHMAKKNKKNRGSERPSARPEATKAPETTAAVETKAKTEVAAPVARPEEKPVEKREEKRDEAAAASNVIQFPAQAKRTVTQVAVNDDVVPASTESRDDTQPRVKTDDDAKAKSERPPAEDKVSRSEPPPKAEAEDEDDEPREKREKRKRKSAMTDSAQMRALGTGDHAVVTEEFFSPDKPPKHGPDAHDDFADLQRSLEPMSPERKQAMWATAGILLVGLVAMGGYWYYHNVHMPQPVELGRAGPVEMPQISGTAPPATQATPPATTETAGTATPPATTEVATAEGTEVIPEGVDVPPSTAEVAPPATTEVAPPATTEVAPPATTEAPPAGEAEELVLAQASAA
ncbi:MAG: DUF4388 domain-containing protein, partial [Sandaracinaceae bacterium]|nr:DUF4388 domain-containing protein [Sandaracinaceae bacterium]